MIDLITPLNMLLVALAGWVNRSQVAVIDYLQEENRVLRDLIPDKRLRLTDDHRRRLAVKGKAVGRQALFGIVGSRQVPPEERPQAIDGRFPIVTHPDEVPARLGYEELRVRHAVSDESGM